MNLLLALLIASASLTACMSPEVRAVRGLEIHPVDLSRLPDGTYEGSYAYGSFTYVVSARVEAGVIRDINILSNRSTRRALMAEEVISRVLAKQGTDVDAVAGATTTSKALLKAVENALTTGG